MIPSVSYHPYHYKKDASIGSHFASHNEGAYRDDTIPFEGALVQYLDEVRPCGS